MYSAWYEDDYCCMLHGLYLEPFGKIVIEERMWLVDRTPVVRAYVDPSVLTGSFYIMPTFTLDSTNPQPVCNTESLSESQIDCIKKWIVKNYVCLWRFWEGVISEDDVDKYLGVDNDDDNVDTESAEDIRAKIREIENEIKAIVGPDPTIGFYYFKHDWETYHKINILLQSRAKCLNKLFRCTPEDYMRIEEINERLHKLYISLIARADELYHSITSSNAKDLGAECLVRAQVDTLVSCYYKEDEILTDIHKLDDDDYYGSDFSYMTFVIQENNRRGDDGHSGFFHQDVIWMAEEEHNADFRPIYDDGHSWLFPLRSTKLDHITFCYLIHRMLDGDYGWSWPDLLHICQYNAEVKIINPQRHFIDRENEYKKQIERINK